LEEEEENYKSVAASKIVAMKTTSTMEWRRRRRGKVLQAVRIILSTSTSILLKLHLDCGMLKSVIRLLFIPFLSQACVSHQQQPTSSPLLSRAIVIVDSTFSLYSRT
jgi:hypothetical protein